jgi:hypothetical protein
MRLPTSRYRFRVGGHAQRRHQGETSHTACARNEKDAKEKLCAGHLKRWYFFGEEVKKKFGADVEIYRCEHCKTLYLPNPEEEPRTGTLSF